MSDPVREFESRTQPFTLDNLQKAREVIAKARDMDWRANHAPPEPHRMPCFPVDDIEWLFRFNHLLVRIVKWACDTEDIDFYSRDHPTDPQAAALLRDIVLTTKPKGEF